jgi:hypothetical protein
VGHHKGSGEPVVLICRQQVHPDQITRREISQQGDPLSAVVHDRRQKLKEPGRSGHGAAGVRPIEAEETQ